MGVGRNMTQVTISALLLRHGAAMRRWHTARASRVGLDDRGALAVAHVVSAGALTPWQLARRLSLATSDAFELVETLELDGYLMRAGGRCGYRLCPTPLALAEFAPPSAAFCDGIDAQTHALLGRFISSTSEAIEREADRLLSEPVLRVERD